MIRQGRISVNGKIVTQLPVLVDPNVDRVAVDDERIKLEEDQGGPRIYILLNKPKGVLATNVAQGEQTLAKDLLPPDLPGRVYPVGRLDSESKGLLLMTNDGELTNQLTHPRYGVPKTYRATVDGFVEGNTLQSLQGGVWMGDPRSGGGYKSGKCHIKIIKRTRDMTSLEITLLESRNTQIRRMLSRAGHRVRDLTRTNMGPLSIEGLPPGAFRSLQPREIRQLQKLSAGREKEPEVHDDREAQIVPARKAPAARADHYGQVPKRSHYPRAHHGGRPDRPAPKNRGSRPKR